MKQLNVGRWIGASLAVLAAYAVTGFLIHGKVLKPRGFYDSACLWRQEGEHVTMAGPSCAFWASLLLFSFAFVWIYHYGRSGRKWEGLRYGIYMCFLFTIPMNLLWYGLQPVGEVAAWWLALEIPQTILLGGIAGAIYKPKTDGG